MRYFMTKIFIFLVSVTLSCSAFSAVDNCKKRAVQIVNGSGDENLMTLQDDGRIVARDNKTFDNGRTDGPITYDNVSTGSKVIHLSKGQVDNLKFTNRGDFKEFILDSKCDLQQIRRGSKDRTVVSFDNTLCSRIAADSDGERAAECAGVLNRVVNQIKTRESSSDFTKDNLKFEVGSNPKDFSIWEYTYLVSQCAENTKYQTKAGFFSIWFGSSTANAAEPSKPDKKSATKP